MTIDAVYMPGRAFAERADREDPLTAFRKRFLLPRSPEGSLLTYFCGNSLGLQPADTRRAVDQVLSDWAARGVEAHFTGQEPWLSYPSLIVPPTAELVGALPEEVTVMNALTVNLHLMLISFYRPRKGRDRILTERHAFPSDLYALTSHVKFRGLDPATTIGELPSHPGDPLHHTEDVVAFLEREGDTCALLLLGGVNYYTGQAFDIERIARTARMAGCTVGLDLAHAAGNIPLHLHAWDVDFAVWCSYKYLNAGPGSPGGVFVHERHLQRGDLPRFAGWWGEEREQRFAMRPEFVPAPHAGGWQISNPPVPMLAAYRSAIALFGEAGPDRLFRRSRALTGYLEYLLTGLESSLFSILTPPDPGARGAQLSLLMRRNGRSVFEQLLSSGIVCDWREPDVIRVAPVPLYNTFTEIYDFVERFSHALRAVRS